MSPLRVFLSYCQEDDALAARVLGQLGRCGARVFSRRDLPSGHHYAPEIMSRIRLSHLVVALLTDGAARSEWVQQEIGYAVGNGVPVLPLLVSGTRRDGKAHVPRGMIEGLHALFVDPELSDLASVLTQERLTEAADDAGAPPLFTVAAYPRERTRMLVAEAETVWKVGGPARVMQRSAFTSFSVPVETPDLRSRLWTARHAGSVRDVEYWQELRRERRSFERHARAAGCDLIISPEMRGAKDAPPLRLAARTDILLAFLRTMPPDKVRVVIAPDMIYGSRVVLGDWFAAEAVTFRAGVGLLQTAFSRRSSMVRACRAEFQREVRDGLARAGRDSEASLDAAIERLEALRARLDVPPFDPPPGGWMVDDD